MKTRWLAGVAALAALLVTAAPSGLRAQEEAQEEETKEEKELKPRDVVASYRAKLDNVTTLAFEAEQPRGDVEWRELRNGVRIIEVNVRDLDVSDPGRADQRGVVDLVIEGRMVTNPEVVNDRVRLKLEQERGLPEVDSGDQVELRWRGQLLMRGTFRER